MQRNSHRCIAGLALPLLAVAIQLATCALNLDEEYRFSATLDNGYKLHWNFDLEKQTIAFAVNVSTTGWVGFGLSPNGQMPQSDVVIGWVKDDGTTTFHVSYQKFDAYEVDLEHNDGLGTCRIALLLIAIFHLLMKAKTGF